MMNKFVLIYIVTFLFATSFSYGNQTPQQVARTLDLSCPIKGKWSMVYHQTSTFLNDINFKSYNGEGRFCRKHDDFEQCKKINPTPKTPCVLVNPLIPRGSLGDLCPITFNDFKVDKKFKNILGGWIGNNAEGWIYLTIFTCKRKYAVDSCRYWFQYKAWTAVSDQGIFSTDLKFSGQMSVCQLDEAAEAAFKQQLEKDFVTLNALIDVKKNIFLKRCPSHIKTCKDNLTSILNMMHLNAVGLMNSFPYDGNPFEVMKEITKIWDPKLEEELKKYPQQSNFPSPRKS